MNGNTKQNIRTRKCQQAASGVDYSGRGVDILSCMHYALCIGFSSKYIHTIHTTEQSNTFSIELQDSQIVGFSDYILYDYTIHAIVCSILIYISSQNPNPNPSPEDSPLLFLCFNFDLHKAYMHLCVWDRVRVLRSIRYFHIQKYK